jgi:glucose-fructose oxidoreductase
MSALWRLEFFGAKAWEGNMKKVLGMLLVLLSVSGRFAMAGPATPLKVGIVGLVHDHVGGFFKGGALAPAGGILSRPDVQVVGIVEPDQKLFDSYAERFHLSPEQHFRSIQEMVARAHPQAILVFTATSEHRRVVEESAPLGVHVMMEKPLATSYKDALAIQEAAQRGKIHVLVNYETSWYPSNTEAFHLLKQGGLGPIVKAVFRDGHQGPKLIGVGPDFLSWLTDPKQNGAGALFDFGCYGPDLMTWFMNGEAPVSVMALAKHLQPELYPKVDDEAVIILNYANAVAIVEASWNWPFGVKETEVFGRTGYARALDSTEIVVRKASDASGQNMKGSSIPRPYDDPLHYFEAILTGEIAEENSLSSLKTNITVTEILDAARQAAQTGKTVSLPLAK